ncbi:E-selectin-like [Dunckerocampus dactyliophorus]|uniref:E-selectin-like n=1 Tax=Dunckerocampus dactyliophorus TaxID=161453 RepID=UPI002406538E|nr:E-selectin-like [Dunckerocampus dactyliophorus]XP_054646900.1 E-selectin-like [Dunckerocampus dactyliophorus]XP_054646901.1 E-selectin-like [Dunckerocampus dactyliophorus]
MELCCGLNGKKYTSWTILAFTFSMLCMQTSVECWSYFYSNGTMTWEEARAWCKESYTDMVAIQNQEEIAHLNSWLPKKPGYYWIGIRKINSTWTWVGTNKALTAEATNWAEGEPNNGKNGQVLGEREDCVEMYIKRSSQPGKWNDERCKNSKTALCYTAACQTDSCIHGECVETINSHRCECFEGFYGDKCEHVFQCNKDELSVPAKGSVDCTGKYGDFSFDALCQYSCEEGYQLNRPGPLRCTASKNWSEPPPTCEVVQCEELSHPDRGSVTCQDPVAASSFQSTCMFTCHEGYVLSGAESLQCEASGSWNASQPTCVAVQCPALSGLQNGTISCGEDPDTRFSYGSTCTFSCSSGYQMVGASTATCTSAGEWSKMMPHCQVVQCNKDELSVPAKGSVDCTGKYGDFSFDALCQYSCEEGYQLNRPGPLRCTASKNWSEPPPTCEVVQCEELSHPDRGSVTCQDPVAASSFQSTCMFTCHEGYVLSGAESLQCEASGSWNASQPTCVAVQCPALSGLQNGTISCGEDADTRFSYGSTCTFSCSSGYQMVGASTVTCTSAGEWSEMMPHCQAITCPAPDVPKRGHLNCTPSLFPSSILYPHDTVCTFSCDEGHQLQGALSMACTHLGQWTAMPPTCSASTSQLSAITAGATIGGAVSLSTLSLVMWVLRRLRRKATKFELSSNSDIEDPPQVYKNSIDSLI